MAEIINRRIMVIVLSKKWLMGKTIIKLVQDELSVNEKLNFKQLKRDRGFLVYLSKTYRNMCSYLKEIH